MRIALRSSLLSLTLLAALSAPANALEIFGDAGLDNAGAQYGTDALQFRQIAQGFTMGSTAYDLSAVKIGLGLTSPVPTSSEIIVSLYSDNGSNLPGSAIGTFNTASPTPAFVAETSNVYEFAYTGTTTLTAGTKYWIVMESISTSPLFEWYFATGGGAPNPAEQNGSGVTYLGTVGTPGNAVPSWGTNLDAIASSNLRFNVVVVPEPSTYALGLVGTLVIGAVARRKGRKTASA